MEPLPHKTKVVRRILIQASHQLGAPLESLSPADVIVRVFDSLDETGFLLSLEIEFGVTLVRPDDARQWPTLDLTGLTFDALADEVLRRWGSNPAATSGRQECRHCGYPTGDIGEAVCPECGGPRF